MTREDTLRIVEEHWDREVEAGCGYTVPALTLTHELVRRFVTGAVEQLPGIEDLMEPRWFFEGVQGKDVLCLASGGGQQSAVFVSTEADNHAARAFCASLGADVVGVQMEIDLR